MESKTIEVGKALAEYIEKLDYGQIIHYQTIEEITRRKRFTSPYYQAVQKAKKILLSNGKAIKSMSGGDYQVLYPGDYSGAYVREVKLAKRHIKRGGNIIKGAPVGDMSSEERVMFNNVSDFHNRLSAQIAGNYVEVKRLSDKKLNPLAAAIDAK